MNLLNIRACDIGIYEPLRKLLDEFLSMPVESCFFIYYEFFQISDLIKISSAIPHIFPKFS